MGQNSEDNQAPESTNNSANELAAKELQAMLTFTYNNLSEEALFDEYQKIPGEQNTFKTLEELKNYAKEQNKPLPVVVAEGYTKASFPSVEPQTSDTPRDQNNTSQSEEETRARNQSSSSAVLEAGGYSPEERVGLTDTKTVQQRKEYEKQEELLENLQALQKQQLDEIASVETFLSRLFDGPDEFKVKEAGKDINLIKMQYEDAIKRFSEERASLLTKYEETTQQLDTVTQNLQNIQELVKQKNTEGDNSEKKKELEAQISEFKADTIDIKSLQPTIDSNFKRTLGDEIAKIGAGTGAVRSRAGLEKRLAELEAKPKEEKPPTLEPVKQDTPNPVPRPEPQIKPSESETTPEPTPARLPSPEPKTEAQPAIEPQPQTSWGENLSDTNKSMSLDNALELELTRFKYDSGLATDISAPKTDYNTTELTPPVDINNNLELKLNSEQPLKDSISTSVSESTFTPLPDLGDTDSLTASINANNETQEKTLKNTELTLNALQQLLQAIPALAINNATAGMPTGQTQAPPSTQIPVQTAPKPGLKEGLAAIPAERAATLPFIV